MAKSKLTNELREEICDLLAMGNTDKDVCAAVKIATSTFYDWIKRGDEAARGKFSDFSEAVTHARADARAGAVEALRLAIEGRLETVEEYSELVTETRVNKNGDPYTFEFKKTSRKTIRNAADWRAAVEYLKRRDPDNWSEKLQHDTLHISIEGAYQSAAEQFDSIIADAAARSIEDGIPGQTDNGSEGGAAI